MWGFFASLVTFVVLCIQTFFSEEARRRKAKEEFDKEQHGFEVIAAKNLVKMREAAIREAQQAQEMEDKVDSDGPSWGK